MSHSFENLKALYPAIDWAIRCASATPMLHAPADDPETLRSILSDGALLPKEEETLGPPAPADYRKPAVYFFVGRPFPRAVGSVIFMLTGDDSSTLEGWGTPFDSGRVLGNNTKLPWHSYVNSTPCYMRWHEAVFAQCREYLSFVLTAYFAAAADYWDGVPSNAIDGYLFNDPRDWWDWTFEVRIETPVGIDTMVLFVDHDARHLIEEMSLRGGIWIDTDQLYVVDAPSVRAMEAARASGVSGSLHVKGADA